MARTKASARTSRPKDHRPDRRVSVWSAYAWIAEILCILLASIKLYYSEFDLLSYQQRNFLAEVGPALWDLVLFLPLIGRLKHYSPSRVWWCTYDLESKTPLLDLPDELLVAIVGYLVPTCPHRYCSDGRRQRQTFSSLVTTNRRIRHTIAPFMYRNVAIVNGWSRAHRALTTIARSPAIQPHVQTLKLVLRFPAGTELVPSRPLAPELTRLLPMLPRLHTLHLYIPLDHTSKFHKQFTESTLRLPGVKCLVLGPDMEFIISHCPNVDSVSSICHSRVTDTFDSAEDSRPTTNALIRAASAAEHLHHLQLHEAWESKHIRQVSEAMPRLRTLAMLGHLAWERPNQLRPALKTLKHLKHLILPDLRGLNIGYSRPHGICGNPYLGPGGKERLERDQREWAQEALEYATSVAELILRHLHGLERLWVGDSMLFTPVRAAPGGGGLEKVDFRYECRPQPETLLY